MIQATLYVGHQHPSGSWSRKDVVEQATLLLVLADIDGTTFIPAIGLWQGRVEESTVIKIILEMDAPTFHDTINALATHLATALHQTCIIVEYGPTEVAYVGPLP